MRTGRLQHATGKEERKRMAKLKGAPNWAMIGRLKPPLDYYQWKGIWVARIYPVRIHQPGTAKQRATWHAMNACVDGWNDLGKLDRAAWTKFVKDSHRTGKDFYYRIHLKGQTEPGNLWNQTKLNFAQPYFFNYQVRLTTTYACRLTLKYAVDQEALKAWGWLQEGYCIRGRKWIRKRKLWENWQREKVQDERGYTTRHTFTLAIPGAWNYITCTIDDVNGLYQSYRGRTGTYYFESGEVYP